jgi:hypothetical protein
MHGIPFLVKDNFYTDDKHNTSEGTLVLLGGRYVFTSYIHNSPTNHLYGCTTECMCK